MDRPIIDLPIDQLHPAAWNPNEQSEETFNQLVKNIEDIGLVQPIMVARVGPNEYEIIGGEHRWKAARHLNYQLVPCFPAGTPICTPEGLKPIEEICGGELVFDRFGKPVPVKRTLVRKFSGDLATVRGRRGIEFKCTDTHGIFVQREGRVEKVPAKYLQPGDLLPNITCEWTGTMLPEWVTPDVAWIVGLYAAEGNPVRKDGRRGGAVIGAQWCLHEDEEYLIERVKDIVKARWGVTVRVYEKGNHSKGVMLRASGRELGEFFANACGCGCVKKHLPWEWMATDVIRKSMVEGVVEGDGSFNERKRLHAFVSVSPELSMQVYQELLHQHRSPSLYASDHGNVKLKSYRVQWIDTEDRRLPEGGTPVTGISLRHVEDVDVFNLEVATLSHSYLVSPWCVPVANCVVYEDFDEDKRKFVNMRMNVITGKISPAKFTAMFTQMAQRYSKEVASAMMGFTSAEEMQKLIKRVGDGLTPEVRRNLQQHAREIHNVRDLNDVLNRIMRDHGNTLQFGFIFFVQGGQTHLMIQMDAALKRILEGVADRCVRDRVEIADVMVSHLIRMEASVVAGGDAAQIGLEIRNRV